MRTLHTHLRKVNNWGSFPNVSRLPLPWKLHRGILGVEVPAAKVGKCWLNSLATTAMNHRQLFFLNQSPTDTWIAQASEVEGGGFLGTVGG